MNHTKIEWTDFTWNPVTGCWGPGGTAEKPNWCPYCYAHRQARRFHRSFEPQFHPQRLFQPHQVKEPGRIFVGSAADLFGDWVPDNWIADIRRAIITAPWHTYIFLTKNPKRYREFNPWPGSCWLLTTITNQEDADQRIPELLKADAAVLGVSAEPLLGEIEIFGRVRPKKDCHYIDDEDGTCGHPDNITPECHIGSYCPTELALNDRAFRWVIIGSMTGPGAKQPESMWMHSLEHQCLNNGVPLFEKNNLSPVTRRAGGAGLIQEWPA